MRFTIYGSLPSLNQYIAACRTHALAGAKMKEEAESLIMWSIRNAELTPVKTPVKINYTWYEPNKKRDHDNVASFGMKAIQDSLVKMGIIPNDGWSDICSFTHTFYCDKYEPRIEVDIVEVVA